MWFHPSISVIVAAYQVEAFVVETLRSIQAQTREDFECIVVDDGSRDATAEVVERAIRGDERFRLVRQSNGGPSMARNRGFMESSAHAPMVVFMDADDVWEPTALERLTGELEKHGDAVGAHALAEMIDASGLPLAEGEFSKFGRRRLGYSEGGIVEWPLSEPTCLETLVWTGPLYPPGLLVARRSAYEKAGVYDTSLPLCEDWDMAIRLSRLGPIRFMDEVILRYRRHGGNLSRDVRRNRKIVRQLHHKTFFSKENSPQQSEMLRLGWRAWQKYKMQEKWSVATDSINRGVFQPMLKAAIETPVHLMRYARGYPSAGGV